MTAPPLLVDHGELRGGNEVTHTTHCKCDGRDETDDPKEGRELKGVPSDNSLK